MYITWKELCRCKWTNIYSWAAFKDLIWSDSFDFDGNVCHFWLQSEIGAGTQSKEHPLSEVEKLVYNMIVDLVWSLDHECTRFWTIECAVYASRLIPIAVHLFTIHKSWRIHFVDSVLPLHSILDCTAHHFLLGTRVPVVTHIFNHIWKFILACSLNPTYTRFWNRLRSLSETGYQLWLTFWTIFKLYTFLVVNIFDFGLQSVSFSIWDLSTNCGSLICYLTFVKIWSVHISWFGFIFWTEQWNICQSPFRTQARIVVKLFNDPHKLILAFSHS